MIFKARAQIQTLDSDYMSGMNISIGYQLLGSNFTEIMQTRRALYCWTSAMCDPIQLIRFVQMPKGPFKLEVNITAPISIEKMEFEIQSFNPEFTSFELWLRVTLVLITFILAVNFYFIKKKQI